MASHGTAYLPYAVTVVPLATAYYALILSPPDYGSALEPIEGSGGIPLPSTGQLYPA